LKYYFDTSALIKAYIEEEGSKKVKSIINSAEEIFVSSITSLECHSTIRRLLLEKSITEISYNLLRKKIYQDFEDFSIIPFTTQIEELAKDYIHQFQLKTLDSIQLASCVSVVADIYSFVLCDDKLFSSAKKLEMEVINPIVHKISPS
jgi:predicted nucleic acid-binding protein